MIRVTDYPAIVFVLSIVAQGIAVWIGAIVLRRRVRIEEETRADFGVIQAATLTLLGLIIGFTFSMATLAATTSARYEEEEANADRHGISARRAAAAGRHGKDPRAAAELSRQRILHYSERDKQRVEQINADTGKLQAKLWAAVKGHRRSRRRRRSACSRSPA